MSWSDAIRAETAFLDDETAVRPGDALARTPWRERSLSWILRLTSVRADDAQKIVADLRAAFLPLPRKSSTVASRVAD